MKEDDDILKGLGRRTSENDDRAKEDSRSRKMKGYFLLFFIKTGVEANSLIYCHYVRLSQYINQQEKHTRIGRAQIPPASPPPSFRNSSTSHQQVCYLLTHANPTERKQEEKSWRNNKSQGHSRAVCVLPLAENMFLMNIQIRERHYVFCPCFSRGTPGTKLQFQES